MCYAGGGCTYPPLALSDPNFVGNLTNFVNNVDSRGGCFFNRVADRSALSLPGTTCASGPTLGSLAYCSGIASGEKALCGPASVLLLSSDSGPDVAFRLHNILLDGTGYVAYNIGSLESDTECLVSGSSGDCSAGWTYIVARPPQTSVACTRGDSNLAQMTCGREAGIFKQDCCPADSLPEDVPITGAVEGVPVESPLPTNAPTPLPSPLPSGAVDSNVPAPTVAPTDHPGVSLPPTTTAPSPSSTTAGTGVPDLSGQAPTAAPAPLGADGPTSRPNATPAPSSSGTRSAYAAFILVWIVVSMTASLSH
jgi:hypothetical protein